MLRLGRQQRISGQPGRFAKMSIRLHTIQEGIVIYNIAFGTVALVR